MTIVVLGANGMLGHKIVERLSPRHDVVGTVRAMVADPALAARAPDAEIITGVSADRFAAVARLLGRIRPSAIVNCIGVIKQRPEAQDAATTIAINAVFPNQLAEWCASRGVRLVHFSTDCVFSGSAGPYRPDALPDAGDTYGRSKALGEVGGPGRLTIRSSVIGHELAGRLSLVDWFLSRAGGEVKGYARALYKGLPAVVMAELVERALTDWRDLHGIWQVASAPISKHDLLHLINARYGAGIRITRDGSFHCDRRLDGSAFAARTGWQAPPWEELVARMHEDFLACGRYGRPPL
jgi:dTDP-4-dehydrorhamnose reductase